MSGLKLNAYISYGFLKKCHFVLNTLLESGEEEEKKEFSLIMEKKLKKKGIPYNPEQVDLTVKYFYDQCALSKTWEEMLNMTDAECRNYFLGLYGTEDRHHLLPFEDVFLSFCRVGHLECVKLFAKDIPIPQFALAEAAEAGHLDVVTWLINNFKTNKIDRSMINEALVWTAYTQNEHVLDFLLEAGPTTTEKAFAMACAVLNLNFARKIYKYSSALVKYGYDYYGRSCLLLACLAYTGNDSDKSKQEELVRFIMNKGLALQKDVTDPIFVLLKKEKYNLVRLLLSYTQYDDLVQKLDFVSEELLSADFKKLGKNEALILACKRGHVEKVRELLINNANGTVTDENGISALEHASRLEKKVANEICVMLLHNFYIYQNYPADHLKRSMVWAIRLGNLKLAKKLYRLIGPDIKNIREGYNNTLMGIACFYGVEESIWFLLGVGVKPTSDDLQRLINIKNKKLYKLLLEKCL